MSTPLRHVIVIGAGLGGLCLAQGLRKAGVSVEVYERDRTRSRRREGFRIHLNPAGSRSLRACLPDRLWAEFMATSGPAGDFGFLTDQLDELVIVEESIMYPQPADPSEDHYAVDRRTLRRLLLSGLDDVVHFGAEFVRYEPADDGRVAAVFADGRRAVGDVLVGADGAYSRVRRQYLPEPAHVETSTASIAHKIFLTEQTRRWLPARLATGMNTIITSGTCWMFSSVFQPPSGGADTEPYILAALLGPRSAFPSDLHQRDSEDLQKIVGQLTEGWHPDLRRALAESDRDSRNAHTLVASPRPAPWSSTQITLLGDAIHTMPPIGGLGGNTALRDARLLCRMLTSAHHGERGLGDAIADYEREMRDYGFEAVDEALRMMAQADTGPLATSAAKIWFRLCRRVAPLRRRAFAESWAAPARCLPWERA
jgi:2-polyprenyl-6-methoxyphenol hydroxylase-like FAD-dependent oxidoreductase